jgi:hypothetical protein
MRSYLEVDFALALHRGVLGRAQASHWGRSLRYEGKASGLTYHQGGNEVLHRDKALVQE